MKEKPLPLNSTVDFQPWEHFNQEYLNEFGGLLRIECSALVFFTTKELIMAQFESGKKT